MSALSLMTGALPSTQPHIEMMVSSLNVGVSRSARCRADAMLCEADGRVLSVLRGRCDFPSFFDAVHPDWRDKARRFFALMDDQGWAAGWELSIFRHTRTRSMVFAGACHASRRLIIGARSLDHVAVAVGLLSAQSTAPLLSVARAGSIHRDLQRWRLDELAHLNDEKTRYLGMVAHDLRQPLSAILLSAASLQMPELATNGTELANEIIHSGRFMQRMIEDLLDATRIEAGTVSVRLAETDLVQLVRRSVTFNQQLADVKHIALTLEIETAPPLVCTDAVKVDRIVNNLLTNAVKYSPPRTTVDIAMRWLGDTVEIRVTDHGSGVPKEQIGRMFKPFVRLSGMRGERGAGLGLSIVAHLIELLDGSVSVTSELGKGSSFTVKLPMTVLGDSRAVSVKERT